MTASINHERMPVLLTDPADFETWLSGSTDEAFKLARSYAPSKCASCSRGLNGRICSMLRDQRLHRDQASANWGKRLFHSKVIRKSSPRYVRIQIS